MSDWGTARSHLEEIAMMNRRDPLTEREKRLARMQFEFECTDWANWGSWSGEHPESLGVEGFRVLYPSLVPGDL